MADGVTIVFIQNLEVNKKATKTFSKSCLFILFLKSKHHRRMQQT